MRIIKYLLVFLIGFFSCALVFSFPSNVEIPLGSSFSDSNAPQDWISEENIQIYGEGIIIKISNASLSRYAPTGSMNPVLDEGANGIRIKPESPDQIKVGDIISYESNRGLIVHRVVEKGIDDKGIYFITKGDNNEFLDGKIRFKDVRYITIGILY